MILVETPEWDDFLEDAEAVATFEAQDGPNLVVALVLRGTPTSASGCTLYVSSYVQDPAPSPTIKVSSRLATLLQEMGKPEDRVGEVIDVRGTFLEGIQPGAMHVVRWGEAHPSIGSATIRLAALSHAGASARLIGDLDVSMNLVMLDALTVDAAAVT